MSKFRKFYVFLLCALSFVSIFYGVENIRGRMVWEDFKKEWKAKGETFDFKEVIPKPVPSVKNFAHAPFLKPLMDYKWDEHLTEATHNDPEELEKFVKLIPVFGGIQNRGKGWPAGEETKMTSWQKHFRSKNAQTRSPWPHPEKPGEPAADVLQALTLSELEDSMEKLTDAAQKRLLCRFDIKYEAGALALLPHLGFLEKVSTAFRLRASSHLANSDPEVALADIQMGLFLAESVKDEPYIISQLVRVACLGIVLQPIWEGLKGEHWDVDQLTAIEGKLAAIDLLKGYQISMLGERDIINRMIDRFRVDSEYLEACQGKFGEIPKHCKFFPGGWVCINKKRWNEMYVKFTQRIIDHEKRRIWPGIKKTTNDRMADHKAMLIGSWNSLFVTIMMPGVSDWVPRVGTTQTAVDHARIACRLERYKKEHGEYPAQLDDLKTDLPKDPYSGKPYGYKPDSNGRYQLYGVGWNEVDEGGKVAWRKTNVDWEQGDLVWSYSQKIPPKRK